MSGLGTCLEVFLRGAIRPGSIEPICQAVGVLLRCGAVELVVCDVERVAEVSAATVDGLARLQLTTRRAGCRMRVRRANGDLRALVSFMGLAGVLRVSGSEPVGEAEEWKEPLGVEEEADPGDPVP
jgi:hypothetical protein